MKKTTVTISYDEEKVKALRLYLELKGSKLEDELTKIIETLYTKIGILLFLQKKFRLSIKKFERRNRFRKSE